ncbi:MAG: hypothetical protein WCI93_03650 [bacterium]
MKKIYQNEFLKWSNLFFLIPLVVATFFKLYWYAVILLVVFIVSYDFHFFSEAKEVYYLDVIFSSILMLSNFILLFMGHLLLPYSLLAVLCALIALFFYFRRPKHDYYFNHSLWHVFSAGVCMFCQMTFLFFI